MRIERIKNTPYDDLVKIYEFDPQGKTFDLNFTKDTCYKLNTGICALDFYKNDLDKEFFDYCKGQRFDRCVRAYLSLKSGNTIGNLPVLSINKCGHYGFTDGQHRICVAMRKNLFLDIEFHETIEDQNCDICEGCNDTIKKIFE